MMTMPILATVTSASSILLGKDVLTLRPFSSKVDSENLSELCKDVWDGTDYLPNVAPLFESDPSCDFVIMEDREGTMVAAGNRRNFDEEGNVIWLEALRVSSRCKGRGIATALMGELIRRSKEGGAREVLSCTIQSNHAMFKVFNRVEMPFIKTVEWLDMDAIKSLPGWAATDVDRNAEHILRALGVEDLVSEEVKMDTWTAVESLEELNSLLFEIKNQGGIGKLPGLGKLFWISKDLKDSLKKGLVLKRKNSTSTAVVALVKDSAIQSLKSKYVCSIAATNARDFESALWHVCSDNIVSALENNNSAFNVAFDGSISTTAGALIESLPVHEKPFVIFRRELQ
jgi:GNAT superfamily N-acetyltransferase